MTHCHSILGMPKTIAFLLLFAVSTHAFAELNRAKERSINNTAETLSSKRVEAGTATISLGITDRLMISIPTAPMAGKIYSGIVKYRFGDPKSPVLLASSAGAIMHDGQFYPAIGGAVGLNLFEKSNALSLTAHIIFGKKLNFDTGAATSRGGIFPWVGLNYDYYTKKKNLFYFGTSGYVPYIGHTWSWKNFQAGALVFALFEVTGKLSKVYPAPYLAARF